MTRLQKSALLVAFVLVVFAAFRALLLLVHHEQFVDLGVGQIISAFVQGVRFDGSIVTVFFIAPLLLMNLPLAFAQHSGWFNAWAWMLFAVTLAMAGLLAADVTYFGFVNRHIGNELMLMGDDTAMVRDLVFGSYKWASLAFVVFGVALFWLWRRILARKLSAPARGLSVKFALLAVVLILVGRGGLTNKPINVIDAFTTGETNFGNLVLNGVFTAAHASNNSKSVNHHFVDAAQALQTLYGEHAPFDPTFPMMKRYDGKKNGYNVVFIMLESWDPSYIDSFGAPDLKLTPFFDQLAAQSLKFENFYAAGQRSIEGAQGALVGLPIITGMPTIGSGLEVSNISRLGTIAKQNNYSTVLVESAPRASFRMGSIAAATGFDEFYGMEDIPLLLQYPDPQGARFGWDYETLMFLKNRLDKMSGPFLSFVFTGTTHVEYPRLPAQFEVKPPSPMGEGGFMNTMVYSDWSMSEFFRVARQSPWFDKTIFILCADHTFGHYEKVGTFPEKFRIPFLIYAPGIYKPQAVHTVGSQLDIMPSIIDMLGFDQPFAALGESLFRKREQYAFVTEGGAIIGLMTPNGFLRHSLKNRMETGAIHGAPPSTAELDAMEKKLLAMDQMVYELIQSNKWAR